MRRVSTALLALAVALAGCPGCPGEDECPSGEALCDGVCRDTQTDPLACGGCGRHCPRGASCGGGVCQCPAGQVPCGLACADLQTDAQNCGACGNRCTAAPPAPPLGVCTAGACVCQGGASACPALDPECRDLQTDPTACGDCVTSCPLDGDVCQGGGCACPAAKPDACLFPDVPEPGLCTDLETDASNCGACGDPCPLANAVCTARSCGCPATLPHACPTACVDLDADEANCGGCGTKCATGATCTAGTPTATCQCPAGEIVCGASPGACVNTQTSASHCGSCGAACASGQACKAGACCFTCPGGACQTEHSNGVGGTYRDCNPLGTYTAAAADAAARSWSAAGTAYPGSLVGCTACLGWQTTTACGVWCWGLSDADALRGRVNLNTASATCICPGLGSPIWN